MNRIVSFSPGSIAITEGGSVSAETGVRAIIHELKNHVCTIGLGIAALKYPEESEATRQHHLAALEAVTHEMNTQFQRLDDWLLQAGYKCMPVKSAGAAKSAELRSPGNGQERSTNSPVAHSHERAAKA